MWDVMQESIVIYLSHRGLCAQKSLGNTAVLYVIFFICYTNMSAASSISDVEHCISIKKLLDSIFNILLVFMCHRIADDTSLLPK
jgi:hypothetical protein